VARSLKKIRFDRFYKYDELSDILKAWAEARPQLLDVSSIGQSFEGRDIWLATITNSETGPPIEKPAMLVEANIHAIEVTGCTAALHLINKLLTEYGKNKKVTRVVDTRTFYVIPRLNPDGAELALADRPKFIRSSVRPYPLTDEQDGLHREDIDGDGRILTMRIPDPNGPWKPHPTEKRLMVRREPDETPDDGQFYRLLPEGTVRNFDGVMIKIVPPLEGLDLNRNFPAEWAPEVEQQGAGPYPGSEPEIRSEIQAIVDRPNICAYVSYHTYSGVHLRPYSGHDDDHFPTNDLRAYKWIGEEATKITGYPAVSIFHDFKYHPKEVIKGGSDDWLYDHLGVFAWTTEFWAPVKEAGIKDYKFIDWFLDHPVEDELALLKWNDKKLDGKGYVDWYSYDHSQLGKVELGGWNSMYCWANIPPKYLEKEIAPHADFAILHLAMSPKLEIHSLDVEKVGKNSFFIRVVLINTGWMPTNVTQKAADRKAVRPLEVELTLPDGARVVGGEKKAELGQLEGRFDKRSAIGFRAGDSTTDRAKAEWVVEAPAGSKMKLEARHQRAGTVRREIHLK
jgi:murein tripeptide amidase MpaA